MFKRIIPAMILILAITASSFLSCGGEEPVQPNKQPSEPEGPPPPPPPPPPDAGGQGGRLQRAAAGGPMRSLEQIAEAVLAGEYGSELQSMLADEVASCLNQMVAEDVVSVSGAGSGEGLIVSPTGNGLIMFNIGYLANRIIDGEFGSDAQSAIRRLGGTSCSR